MKDYTQNWHSVLPPASTGQSSPRMRPDSRGWRDRIRLSMEKWQSHVVEGVWDGSIVTALWGDYILPLKGVSKD